VHFRALETQVLRDAAKNPGIILDCGGGVVTREENDEALRQNGFIVFLNRGWQGLPTDGRPLSQQNALSSLYSLRLPRYRALCDVEIDSTDLLPEQTAEKILEAFADENSCT
jgi:shikimate dehydrogenase